ncbi:MAG: HYR domain-containing protein, partial [Salinimicrobium sp.]
ITADELNDGSSDNCEIVSKTLNQFDFTSADLGVVPVTLTVTDAASLSDQCTVQVTVEDTPAPENPEAVCKDIPVSLNDNGEASITAQQVYGGTDSTLELDIDVSSFDCSNLGENKVLLTVTDPATGLSADCTATVTVEDNTPPEISCTPLTVYLNSEGTVKISAEAVGKDSFDNCGISQMFLDNDTFRVGDIGQQMVRLTAVDASGNESSCQTTVNVKPFEELPAGVICPEAETIPLDEDGEVKSLRVKYDGSADLDFELSRTYFTCDDIGSHTLNVSWTGDFTGSCTSEVTIVDNTPPSLSCASNLDLRLNASGTANITANDVVETAYDNCTVEDMYLDRTSFSAEDLGEQIVRVTVVDNSGNESFCQVRVNVLPFEDEVLPIQCAESIVIELDETGKASINPREVYSGGTGSVQFTLSKEEFSCSDLGINYITFSYTTPQESGSCEIEVEVKDPLNACVTTPPVEPPAEEGFLLLYPNPSHGKVKVIAPDNILLERAEVYDMRGRFLFSRNFDRPENTENTYDLDLSKLQSGVYNIKFLSKDEKYIRRAIISND